MECWRRSVFPCLVAVAVLAGCADPESVVLDPDASGQPDLKAPGEGLSVTDGPTDPDSAAPDTPAADLSATESGGTDGPADSGPVGTDAIDPGPDTYEDPTCPEEPPGLPEVTIEGSGRWLSFGPIGTDELLPRLVRVYLPAAYMNRPDARFPVLYMHDGQNLFDKSQAAFGVEWQVDEVLDALTASGEVPPFIVVGVDNTAERADDYTPVFDASVGAGGKGDLYADFLAGLVKPLVDKHFRTLCGRSNTGLVGSSLGGLISLHVAMRHPGVFGLIGCVSSAFWWGDREIFERFATYSGPLPLRLWLDAGSQEGGPEQPGVPPMIADARGARDIALAPDKGMQFGFDLACLEDSQAPEHNEAAWAYRLDSILRFLLADEPPGSAAISQLSVHLFGGAIYADGGLANTTNLAVETVRAGVRLTPPNSQVELTSLHPAIASVSSDGTVTGLSSGVATIRAEAGGLEATDTVEVFDGGPVEVTFHVTVPAGTTGTIYVVGDLPALGGWLAEAGVPLAPIDAGQHQGSVTLVPGAAFEYKYTRGSWETVEKAANGGELENRLGVATQGALYQDAVATWADWVGP